MLGLPSGSTGSFDDNGPGYGWFFDATPWDEYEFAVDRTEMPRQKAAL